MMKLGNKGLNKHSDIQPSSTNIYEQQDLTPKQESSEDGLF